MRALTECPKCGMGCGAKSKIMLSFCKQRYCPWKERAKKKWPWRDFLTAQEKAVLAKADTAKRQWQKLNQTRSKITNRAIHRAKYSALAATHGDGK